MQTSNSEINFVLETQSSYSNNTLSQTNLPQALPNSSNSSEREQPILIVDDDPGMRTMLQTVLEYEGYRVEVARNGQEALEWLTQFKPSLILLDLMMPVMDGWQFLEEIQKDMLQPILPIVVLSASRELARVAKCLGVKAFLPKPFDLEKLLQFVRQFRNTILL